MSILIPVQGSDEAVEVQVDELPEDANDVVDILQAWTLRKRLERLAKTWLRCQNAKGMSAMPPPDYALRFTERVIFDVFDAHSGPEALD